MLSGLSSKLAQSRSIQDLQNITMGDNLRTMYHTCVNNMTTLIIIGTCWLKTGEHLIFASFNMWKGLLIFLDKEDYTALCKFRQQLL